MTSTKQWFVLRVQSGREDKVREALLKRIKAQGLEGQINNVIVPTEKVSEIRSGKKTVRERKIYPGYIMVEMETNDKGDVDDQAWFLVRETPGIGDFLGLKRPRPMLQHEVDKILTEATAVAEKPKVKIDFQKGDAVRVKEGPFENFEGVVDAVIPAKGQVKVTLTIFGRATQVELEYWQVEKA
jgi:transcriptional antiterminator NusG